MNPLYYAFGGGLALALIFGGLQTFRLTIAQRDVAIAMRHQAEAESVAGKVNEIFARNEAQQERARAKAIQEFTDERNRLRNERDAIETRFKNVSADRSRLSAENRRLIADAPKADSRPLGPTMLTLFARLREQQQAARAGHVTPACGVDTEERLPGRSTGMVALLIRPGYPR